MGSFPCHPCPTLRLLWAWFDFVLLEVFHFQTEFSPGNSGEYTWTGWVCLANPALHNEVVSCDNPWRSVFSATFPPGYCRAWTHSSSVPPSGTGTAGSALCALCFGSLLLSWTVVRPSPTSQGGWHLVCSLRVKDSFGFLWSFISRG